MPDAPDIGLIQLLPTPVDMKACQADLTTPNGVQQVDRFTKPLRVQFDYDAGTVARAGGKTNITIVQLQNRQWVDLEELGSRMVRDDTSITGEVRRLGAFSIVVR
jgi:hypothetical protein